MTLPDPDGPTNPLPRRYTFTPDGLGRNTQIVNSITGVASAVTLVQAFDSRNNRTQLTASIGSTLDFKNTYTYDALSRNVQIVQQGQSGGNTVLAKRVNLAYDAAGELQKLSRYADTAGTQLVSTSDYAFDRLGRLTFLQHSQANREIASYRMAYDVLDRLTRLDDAIDEVSLYGYDTLGQLTTADHTFENDESYTYDANGNRTGAGYDTSVTNNQLDSDPNYNYTFDAEGNRASRTSKATGNIEEYAYDQRNRLAEVTFKNAAGTAIEKIRYSYDAFDRLVKREEDSTAEPSPAPPGTFNYADARTEVFVYDGDDIVLDFLDTDGTGQNPPTLQERYLFGPAVDQVLAQENVVSGAGQTVLWHLTDNLGSVRDLVRSDGTTAAHYQYDAFGNLLDGYEDQTRYQFTGREHDPDTGLQYNRARWYDPQSGQWMSEDPIGFATGDANLRRYVGNGSTNFVDPSGMAEIWPNDPTEPGPPGSNSPLTPPPAAVDPENPGYVPPTGILGPLIPPMVPRQPVLWPDADYRAPWERGIILVPVGPHMSGEKLAWQGIGTICFLVKLFGLPGAAWGSAGAGAASAADELGDVLGDAASDIDPGFAQDAVNPAPPANIDPGFHRPPGVSNPSFGTLIHQRFPQAIIDQTGTDAGDWIFNTDPGQSGVDAIYRGSQNLGFHYGELKPYTSSPGALKCFERQVDNWGLPSDETLLWLYNQHGIIGSSGYLY